ncbi:uncharacterized protein LOC107801646 isoform X1 [Nicotiana tabacum]|uniref:Uncharacterized protein LOC107801646 isoform X1 n=1 Tax=Nicotiana tabacum TaxID=4097 RepID=A0AC58USE8_TOBAC
MIWRQYTWFRGNNEHSASRIDRFLISSQWDNSFKAIKQSVLPRVELDHCPILLECGEWERSKGYFKFENMWFEHVNFISTVKKWWNSYDFQGRPDVVLAKKLRKLKEDLKKWNKETFGHLEIRKDQNLHQLEMEQQNDNHNSNTEEEEPAKNALINELHHIAKVGIYGYTAYSASKFGLKGLAEALQQEVIGENIHVSLIFPPDTETPGFAEENKRRPRVTSIIAASSGAMKADEVAKIALNGIKSGNFTVPCNFEGFLLSIATAGLSPQRSFLMAFVEVIAAGILRVAGLCFQWNWYGSIEKCLEKGNSK